jgi:hypothetical protein
MSIIRVRRFIEYLHLLHRGVLFALSPFNLYKQRAIRAIKHPIKIFYTSLNLSICFRAALTNRYDDFGRCKLHLEVSSKDAEA